MADEPLPPSPMVNFPPGYEQTTHAVLAALLLPPLFAQRVRFVDQQGREPNAHEREEMVNAVLNEWARLTEILRQRFEEGERPGRR